MPVLTIIKIDGVLYDLHPVKFERRDQVREQLSILAAKIFAKRRELIHTDSGNWTRRTYLKLDIEELHGRIVRLLCPQDLVDPRCFQEED